MQQVVCVGACTEEDHVAHVQVLELLSAAESLSSVLQQAPGPGQTHKGRITVALKQQRRLHSAMQQQCSRVKKQLHLSLILFLLRASAC